MVTLKDIAAEAGVSITTVSNVVHNRKSRVSEKKVAKIWEIIEREHYVPSMSARSLANDQSAIIAMVTYMIHSWRLSGLIMTGLFQDSFFDAVAKLGIPVVLIDSYVDDPNICCVGLEDEKGGYLATKHLLENGHRVIAFASPPISPAGVIELRLQGYRRALAEYVVPYDPALVFTQEISVQEGKKLGHQLSTLPEITGIFASADILAAGIMSGLHECGVSVPRDKSIVGFDDHYISQLAIPGLTTIHQDSEKKGTLATEMILAQLRKEEIAQKKVILPVHLVERGSVRNIKG